MPSINDSEYSFLQQQLGVAGGGALGDLRSAFYQAALGTVLGASKGTVDTTTLRNTLASVVAHDDSGTVPLRIIGLGSSVGAGATLPDPSTQAPVARFAARMQSMLSPLGSIPVPVLNGSVNGSTVAGGQQGDYAAAKTVAGGTPTLTVLAYGMNDAMPEQYHRGQTYPGFYSIGKQLIQQLQVDGSDVVLLTTPHPRTDVMTDANWALSGASQYPSTTPIPATTQADSVRMLTLGTEQTIPISYRHLRINQSLRRLAAETGATLLDVERYWFKAVAQYGLAALFNQGEYAHPNLFGHQRSYWMAIEDFVASYRDTILASAPTPPPAAPQTVVKVDNKPYTSTTTLAGDAQLALPVAANRVYRVSVTAFYTGSTGGDIRLGLMLPAGATGSASIEGTGTNAATFSGDTSTFRRVGLPDTYGLPAGCNGADAMAKLTAIVRTTTAGSITAAFCQDTSSGSPTTVYADSFMTLEQLS